MSPSRLTPVALLLVLLIAPPAAAQDTLPPGSPIGQGVGLDLTEGGINFLLSVVGDFLPPDLVIGTIPEQELLDILFCQETLALQNLILHTEINSITVDATPSALNLVADIDLWINTPDDPAIMTLGGCAEYVCLLHTAPANIVVSLPITMELTADADGDPFIDVTIGSMSHNILEAMTNKVHMTGCALGEFNETLSDFGLNIFDLVLGQLVTQIETSIEDQTASLEETIEEALLALWIPPTGEPAPTLDALGTELSYTIHPTEVEHNDHGLRLVMGGAVSAEPAQCVARFDDEGSIFTASNIPGMTPTIPNSDQGYHVGVLLSDDFVNQAAHAAWMGGVLCYVVEDLGSAPLTTTYLGLLLGLDQEERLVELLGEDETPMLVRTVPETPPLVRFDGDHDIEIVIQGLNIEFYPLILDRPSRLASVAIDITAGIDLGLAPDDALQIDIYLDTEQLNPRVTYNEIAPDLNEALEGNFATFLSVVIDTVAGSMLEGMAIGLPTFSGLGLTGLDVLAVGESPTLLDFLGVYAVLGETDGGTSSGGCDSCSTDSCADDGCGDACGEDSGCGGEEGCDAETLLGESGCTGEATTQPSDVGCTSCRLGARQLRSGHWRVVIDRDGTHHHHTRRAFKVGLQPVLLVLGPLIYLARRRRSATERPAA